VGHVQLPHSCLASNSSGTAAAILSGLMTASAGGRRRTSTKTAMAGSGCWHGCRAAALVPCPDPHRRPRNPLENADATGPRICHVLARCCSAFRPPAWCWQVLLHGSSLRWAGIPVGAATGVLLYAWLGHADYRRLEARGPELLLKMRAGRSSTQPRRDAATVQIRSGATELVSALAARQVDRQGKGSAR